jgi:Predicted signal transduction protein with a C-terminal ATPase domain
MYSVIIISVLLITTSIFYFWMSNQLRGRAAQDILEASATMSQKLNDEIADMDNVSMNVCYSNLVKSQFEYYTNRKPSDRENLASINNAKELTDILTAIIGPNFKVQQIFLYNFNGQVFGTGFDNRQMASDIKKNSLYREIEKQNGKKVVSAPEENTSLSSIISTSNSDMYFISLYRLYFDKFNTPQGIVQVIQYADNVFSDLSNLESSNTLGETLYVFNSAGRQVYPYSGSRRNSGEYYYKLCRKANAQNFEVNNPNSRKKDLVAYTTSDYTGFTTIAVSDENVILASFGTFSAYSVIMTVLILFIALLFSFYAARSFTKPIKTLRHNMRTIVSHDQLEDIPDLKSGLTELEELNESFRHMNRKVKKSLDELLLSQKNEMNSKMLALQSQMNPHFLFNSLATISAMAEENLDDEIIKMCDNMCDMLRYISSDISKSVPLGTEINHLLKYVECIRLRFGDRIHYSVDLDEKMMGIEVPKLVIQPLVENAIKYASLTNRVVEVRVSGKAEDGRWSVSVQDNGPGFSAQALDRINGKIEEIEKGGLLPSLEIEGMGLINIYIRLKLMYKSNTIFGVRHEQSAQDGGSYTVVEVGGSAQTNAADSPG